MCGQAYERLMNAGMEPLLDDRDMRAGGKFADMDLIGLPWQIIVGPKGVAAGMVELKNRRTGDRAEITLDQAISQITG